MSLIAHWPLNGNLDDISGNGNHATNDGTTFVNGKIGQGAFFDGAGTVDGVTPGANIIVPEAITNTNSYPKGCTYSFWLNVDNLAVDRMSLLWGSSTIRHIELFSSGKYFRTEAAIQNGYSFGSGTFPNAVRNSWSHFTIVFANNEPGRPVRWYQDGVLFHTGSLDGGANPGTEYFMFSRIGRSTGSVSYNYAKSFHGILNDFRIYDEALTDIEIQELSRAKILHYTLDDAPEENKPVYDYSGFFNHSDNLILANTPSLSNEPKIGQGAYLFDGVNDYVKNTGLYTVGLSTLTIAGWIKPEAGGSNYRCALHKGADASVGGSEFWFGVSSGGYLTATIGARLGVGWSAGQTTTLAVLGTWYHLAAVWDGSVVKVYINGVFDKQYTLSGTALSLTTPTRLGASSDGANYQYSGLVDDVRIYTIALSDEDILDLYETRAEIEESGVLYSRSFEEYSNWDESINNTNLVLNGDGSFGDLTNFSGFTGFDEIENAFYKTSGSTTLILNEYVEVKGNGIDSFEQYIISADHKQPTINVALSRYYFMIACYDKNFRFISNQDVNVIANTATTLAQDLNPGDTVVHLVDVSNSWLDDGTNNYQHYKGIALWHPTLDGSPYDAYKYTRRWQQVIGVDKVNNTITLRYAYSGDALPAGSPAQNHQSGGTYSYIGASNHIMTSDWINRESPLTTSSPSVGSMRYGSKYIRLGWLINRNAGVETSYVRNVKLYNMTTKGQQTMFLTDEGNVIETGTAKYNNFSTVGITDGLEIYLPLNEQTIKNLADTNHNSITVSSPVYSGDNYFFDGVDDRIDTGFNGLPDWNTTFSLSIMVKIPTSHVYSGAQTNIIGRGGYGGSVGLVMSGDTNFNFYLRTDSGGNSANLGAFNRDEWYHLVGTWDGNDNMRSYKNGVLITNTTVATKTGVPDADNWHIALARSFSGFSGGYLTAYIKQAKVFNRVLTAEEVKIEYNTMFESKLQISESGVLYAKDINQY